MSDDDPAERTASMAARLAAIDWAWDIAAFDLAVRSAGATSDALPSHEGWTSYALGGDRLDVLATSGMVERLEATIEAFVDVPDLSGSEYEDKRDEFYELWENASAAAERRIGPPIFQDGGAARGYPADQDAEWVTLWRLPTARLMIQELHEDRELPFRLAVVVTPHVSGARSAAT